MYTDFTSVTWDEALRSFAIHLKAVRASKTVIYYQNHVKLLARWCETRNLSIQAFGKRQLDEYLSERSDAGLSQTTLHHEVLCAKVFVKWCQQNDIVERSLIADYEDRNATKPHKYMPSSKICEH